MSVLDDITRDLDWRESEIASMRILLSSPGITQTQRTALLRASWALLYAHFEGFCKNALVIYYDFISRSGVSVRDLPDTSKVFALEEKLKELRKLPSDQLLVEISNFEASAMSISPDFPSVDTQSNLWPNVLKDLLEIADLSVIKVQEHELKLKTLVSRRNKIAHGEHNMIPEVSYYKEFESAVYDVIYDLAYQIEARLSQAPFGS